MLGHDQNQLSRPKDFLGDHEIVIGEKSARDLKDRTTNHATERMDDAGIPASRTSMTSLQRRNEELAAALRQARSVDRARTDFFAMVTHEMRTPLNAITGFSDA